MEPTAGGRPEHRGAVSVHPTSGHEERAARDLAALEDWLREAVGRPSPRIGRSGAVCPFTTPALRAGALDSVLRYDVDGSSPDLVRTVVYEAMRSFTARHRKEGEPLKGTRLECEVVAFPLIGPAHWSVIDKVHPELKDVAVELGLMLGQFHPACDERAARNPLFPVARSPYPLFAIRFMAPHDVLFLNGERRWFERYRENFPEEAAGAFRDPFMRGLAAEASRRFAPSPVGTPRGRGGERR
ncbi:DUF6875 domain-containing protein [Nocardiopsis sp. CA-288880]|uniref:DUF6875 domain-containing protein n=1 Tax=Nocardiopsis sp. CA-288880 TaxID=3239995 RepID=UPI003D956C97